MKKHLLYMRQLGQRRLSGFQLSLYRAEGEVPSDPHARQLVMNYGQTGAVDARDLRRRITDAEDDDDL